RRAAPARAARLLPCDGGHDHRGAALLRRALPAGHRRGDGTHRRHLVPDLRALPVGAVPTRIPGVDMNLDIVSSGLDLLLQPESLLWLIGGLILGFVVGVLPGLSTSNTAALLLPFAIGLPTESSLILIVSIYAGAQFGGAVPAILVNVPGEAGSAVTALDGYQYTRRGEAALAIGIARMAAAIGGVVGGVVVLVLLGPLGELALSFGARELFVVILLGFVVASSLMGESVRKGLMVGLLGLLLATVGGGPTTGQERFTFGVLELYEGISFIPALVGLCAVSEMLILLARHRHGPTQVDVDT